MQFPSWLNAGLGTYGYWIVFVAVALESMGVPFPGETALVAGAVYAGVTGELNIAVVIVAAAAGAILGDNIGYTVGYRGGRALIERIGHALHLNLRGLRYTERYFQQHGDKTVFFGRFVSILRTYVALFAGINRMHWRRFFAFNAAGGITWALIYGLLGYFLGGSPLLPKILHILGVSGLVVLGAVIVALLVGIIIWRRRREDRVLGESKGAPDASDPPACD